jgi:phosphodiesterase/alkaline phosphatase D-like protein
VKLENLQPNQKVYYIASNNGTEWSDEKWFISPDVSSKKFNFITFGDTGTCPTFIDSLDTTPEFRGNVDRLLKEYESDQSEPPRLVLHTGDFAYAGKFHSYF